MIWNAKVLCPDADAAFERFFEELGYSVYWEGRRETGERWYEICDPAEGHLCFQISMPAPSIAELIVDLPLLVEGKPSVGPTNYWRACENNERLGELLRRVNARETA